MWILSVLELFNLLHMFLSKVNQEFGVGVNVGR